MNGLYQMGARYYQPGSGRFTQMDPLPKSIISANRYAYAVCNPSNNIDPTGLFEMTSACWEAVVDVTSVVVNFLPLGWLYQGAVKHLVLEYFQNLGWIDSVDEAFTGDPTDLIFEIASWMVGVVPPVGPFLSAVVDSLAAIPSITECVRSQP